MKSTFQSTLAHRLQIRPVPTVAFDEGESLVLAYTHRRLKFPRLSTVLVVGFFVYVLFLTLGVVTLLSPWTMFLTVLAVSCIGYVMEEAQNCMYPKQIWLNKRGIQLAWHTWWGKSYSPPIPWTSVRNAKLAMMGIFSEPCNALVTFSVPREAISGYETLLLCFLYPTFWSPEGNGYFNLRFHIDGLDPYDRRALSLVLQGCMEERRIDPMLINALDPGLESPSPCRKGDATPFRSSSASVPAVAVPIAKRNAGSMLAHLNTPVAEIARGAPSAASNETPPEPSNATRVAELLNRLDYAGAPKSDSDDDECCTIAYRPPGFLTKYFSNMRNLAVHEQLAAGLLPMAVFLLLPPFIQVLIAVAFGTALFFEHIFKPTHLEVSPAGMRFKWNCFACSELLDVLWTHVSHVSLLGHPSRLNQESDLVFEMDNSPYYGHSARLVRSSSGPHMYMRIALDGFPGSRQKKQFLRSLCQYLPADTMSQELKNLIGALDPDCAEFLQKTNQIGRDRTNEVVLRYKQYRWLQKKLHAFERGSLHLFMTGFIVIGFLAITFPLLNVVSALVDIVCVCSLAAAAFWLVAACTPSHLLLNEQGIRLRWRRLLMPRFISPTIPWGHTTYVGATMSKKNPAELSSINLNVYARDMRLAHKYIFSIFSSDFFFGKDNCQLYFSASGLNFADQQKLLFDSLTRYVSPERLDPQLLNALVPQRPTTYTALWLDCLSNTKQRVRTEPLEEGALLRDGRFEIIKQIGSGGQGVAYKAWMQWDETSDGRELAEASPDNDGLAGCAMQGAGKHESEDSKRQLVVLKEFILPSHGGVGAQQRTLESIEREANLLKSMDHCGVVKLLDTFVEDHRCYLVLEHASGHSLRSLVAEKGPLDENTVASIGVKLCSILDYLHGQNPPVIHRDFTPENIIIDENWQPKLIDFNVARQTDTTSTRTVVGKHSYIPPEQFRGKASPQSDIYALGCTLYFALTGKDPEPITSSHPRKLIPGLSEKLDSAIARATAIDAASRYATASELVADLQEEVR